MRPIYLTYLNRLDIDAIGITGEEILAAIETSLATQGRGEAVIEPRVHLEAGDPAIDGHFNVLRGCAEAPPSIYAGVKVVGDFVDNYKDRVCRRNSALLQPVRSAVPEYPGRSSMRPPSPRCAPAPSPPLAPSIWRARIRKSRAGPYRRPRLRPIGTSDCSIHLFHFDEIRVHSRRPESREAFAAQLCADLGREVTVTEDWQSCVEGADIVVEASRLDAPAPMLCTAWIKPGALVIPYGTMSAVELDLTDIMAKLVVDDWGQVHAGRFGALRAHVDAGKLTRETLHAEMGQIVAGLRPGRESEEETILFWHRGLSLSDIALGHAMLAKGERLASGSACVSHDAVSNDRGGRGATAARRRRGDCAARRRRGADRGGAARVAAGHAALEAAVARGEAIYGVSTGLGAAVDTRGRCRRAGQATAHSAWAVGRRRPAGANRNRAGGHGGAADGACDGALGRVAGHRAGVGRAAECCASIPPCDPSARSARRTWRRWRTSPAC